MGNGVKSSIFTKKNPAPPSSSKSEHEDEYSISLPMQTLNSLLQLSPSYILFHLKALNIQISHKLQNWYIWKHFIDGLINRSLLSLLFFSMKFESHLEMALWNTVHYMYIKCHKITATNVHYVIDTMGVLYKLCRCLALCYQHVGDTK